jgi:hypothetical protein
VVAPAIYLIPECDTDAEVDEVLRQLCEEIFIEQLAGWLTTERRGGLDTFRKWFDFQHHSMLVDPCDEPLILESE